MDRYEISLNPLEKSDAETLSSLSLAYMGDTVYDLYIRGFLVKNRLGTVHVLHNYAASMVNAKAQAAAAEFLIDELTDEEKAVFKRGRNAKSGGVPKNMEVADYRKATGIEAVFGYLFVLGRKERLDELMKMILDNFFTEE